ncbi:MAG: topoisomerase DNA-binding C4 zinc finger domain-containing protein, partial [Clostridia bacterium]|nr:topoisomerase DNA-binding C4 zinc finger domain-containing protein [Clostridia bacterium]
LKNRLNKLSNNKDKLETLKNEFVKSNEELVIANYLFTNGINYEYEKPYEIETSTLEKRQYTPDFYLPDYGIYLEHYGIDRNGRAPQYEKEASEEYIHSMEWKREIHVKNETKCIETYSYEFNEGTIFDNLRTRLKNNGVVFNPLTQEEIFNALHNVYSGRDFSSFFNLITTFLSLYKAQIKDDKGFEKLKEQLNNARYDTYRTRLFLDICNAIYNYYIYNLRDSDKIDFDDMILQSIDLLDDTQNFKYKYIIVDEFQDISQSRTKFLQKLIEHGNAKLFAVGDDWQAIYRFAGCDINVFLEFETIFKGAKLNYITSTHRNSTELQLIVEPFITANPNQYKKHIKSAKHQDKPVRIIYHKGNKAMAFTAALADISKINSNASVLVLGRNRRDIDSYICKEIQIFDYKVIKHINYPTLNLSYSTVHGSKGLESDFVILVSGEDDQNGFPNKTEDDTVLSLILGKKDSFEYAEERRLFYVALTRTKSIVYLLSEKGKSSEFIQEIKNKCYIMEDETERKNEDEYLCPWCRSGHLIVRTSEIDRKSFYGCSNYPYCTYTNNDMKAVYFNNRCPKCGDFLVLRKGRYGTFFGCHNYPRCNHTQQEVNEEIRNKIGF